MSRSYYPGSAPTSVWKPAKFKLWGPRMLGPAATLIKFLKGPRLHEALIKTGYKCKACPTLLASGARCPTHPAIKPWGNHGWVEFVKTRAPWSEINRRRVRAAS